MVKHKIVLELKVGGNLTCNLLIITVEPQMSAHSAYDLSIIVLHD